MSSTRGSKKNEHESGVLAVTPNTSEARTETIESACHQIIDAVSGLTFDLEFIASAEPGEVRDASIVDAHENIATVAKLVMWIRQQNTHARSQSNYPHRRQENGIEGGAAKPA